MKSVQQDEGLFSRPAMVRWFSPTLLANAAGRAIVSPIFGTYADQRMSQATIDGFDQDHLLKAVKRHQYTTSDFTGTTAEMWVDFLADTGDGFDSVYAMASLVAADQLSVKRRGGKESYDLPSGDLLVLGGDQVYPYPSRDEYKARFVAPFSMAFAAPAKTRRAFVLPGNHDWYDGLNAFDFLFCQERYGNTTAARIEGLIFPQHRSYFAVRLPHNWWIWGADIQFSQYLDVGQVKYFQTVAAEMLKRQPGEPEHKVILCIAEPGWQYEGYAAGSANSNLEIVAGIVQSANARIAAVLSGDSHHYCRYRNEELNLNLITAGGGGAFLHPTHQLRNHVPYAWFGKEYSFHLQCKPLIKGTGMQPATFPSRRRSFWLTWQNLLFPIYNPTFAMLLGTFYWIMTWMFAQTPVRQKSCLQNGLPPLVEDILVYARLTCGLEGTFLQKLDGVIHLTVHAGVHQFMLGVFALLLFAILVRYADARRRWRRIIMGAAHWFAHIAAMVGLYLAINYYGFWSFAGDWTANVLRNYLHISDWTPVLKTVFYIAQMVVVGGFVAGFIWGFYLFVCCAFGRRHTNDAFSALRLQNYKNFLRMKLEPDRLTIFPIGLRRVPTRVGWTLDKGRYVPRIPFSPELIDGPIVIDAADPRQKARPLT